MNFYETNFYAWTQHPAEALKQHQWERLELPNWMEKIEALERRERQELRNRLSILLGHILKWQYHPELKRNSWLPTIREQLREILTLSQENLSLKPYLQETQALLKIIKRFR